DHALIRVDSDTEVARNAVLARIGEFLVRADTSQQLRDVLRTRLEGINHRHPSELSKQLLLRASQASMPLDRAHIQHLLVSDDAEDLEVLLDDRLGFSPFVYEDFIALAMAYDAI